MKPELLVTFVCAVVTVGWGRFAWRVKRELAMKGAGEVVWLPWADRLLLGATIFCLLFVLIPLVRVEQSSLPTAAAGSTAILLVGYIPACFSSLSIFPPTDRDGPRENPEPAEGIIVKATAFVAVVFFSGFLFYQSLH